MSNKIDYERLLKYTKKRKAKNKFFRWRAWRKEMASLGKSCIALKSVESIECDVLVLHGSEDLKNLNRKKLLIDSLREKKLSILEDVHLDENEVVETNSIIGPNHYDDFFKIYEGYAKYIKQKYKAKIIVTERNGQLLAPFLKARFDGDSQTLHLPHCVLNDQTRNHSMMDYDHFPIYGPSSLNYLKMLKHGYGQCKLYFGGSYLFDETFALPNPDKNKPILYLGMGPQLEEKKRGVETNRIVAAWQKKTGKKLLVRLHQRSKGTFWKELKQEGVTILPPEPFVESAKRCSMMLSPYTNAVVDACLLKKPCQLIALPHEVDYLEVEKFFGPRATNAIEVEAAIDRHFNNFEDSLKKCDELKDYHLSQGNQSVKYLSQLIVDLVNGKKPQPVSIRKYDGTFIDS